MRHKFPIYFKENVKNWREGNTDMVTYYGLKIKHVKQLSGEEITFIEDVTVRNAPRDSAPEPEGIDTKPKSDEDVTEFDENANEDLIGKKEEKKLEDVIEEIQEAEQTDDKSNKRK
jgi:hypothetical protein